MNFWSFKHGVGGGYHIEKCKKKKITLHKIRAEESLFLVGVYNGEQRHWIVDS